MQRHTLIALIVVSTVALAIILMYALLTAPLFTLALLAICAMAVLFVLSEQSQTHDAAEYENRFWTSMAFVLACACLYSADSPLRFPEDHPGVAFAIVVLFTFLAHNYDRHLRRLVLSKIPNIKKVRSADFPAEYRVNASEKCAEIRRLVASIDQTWMSSTILNLFFLPFVLFVEHQIVTIFAEANRDELNLIISGVELGLIFYKIKDHKIANRYNRTKLLKLLSFDRVTEMNIPVRALVVDGMQRLKISANPQCEIFVANIFLKTKGDELSELKSLTDSKGDFNSMHRLIFTDIRTPEVKKRLLDYIQQQANVQDAHKKLGTKKSKVRDQFAWRKILSDVDDTLTSSGGSWPAGMDTSFPKKAIYPGVLAFYRELDLGTSGSNEWDNSRVGNLVFLSARPHVYKDMSESVTYAKCQMLQQTRGLYTCPSLLAGSLDAGSKFMIGNNAEPVAQKKFDNLVQYLALYPEFSCIFVGDNGQGDVRTAEMALLDSTYKNNLQRIYIHQVQPVELTYTRTEAMRSTNPYKNQRVCYFHTYVEAAIDAYQHNLILPSGLRRIMVEAIEDFHMIPLEQWRAAGVPTSSRESRSKSSTQAKLLKSANKAGIAFTDSSLQPLVDDEDVSYRAPAKWLLNRARKFYVPSRDNGTATETKPAASTGVPTTPVRPLQFSQQVTPRESPQNSACLGPVAADSPVLRAKGFFNSLLYGPEAPKPTANEESLESLQEKDTLAKPVVATEPTSSTWVSSLRQNSRLPPLPSFPVTSSITKSTISAATSAFASTTRRDSAATRVNTISEKSTGKADKDTSSTAVRIVSGAVLFEKFGGILKREERLRELNKDLAKGNALLRKIGQSEVELIPYIPICDVGTTVLTMFGLGVVQNFRSQDGIYEVVVQWRQKSKTDQRGKESAEPASVRSRSNSRAVVIIAPAESGDENCRDSPPMSEAMKGSEAVDGKESKKVDFDTEEAVHASDGVISMRANADFAVAKNASAFILNSKNPNNGNFLLALKNARINIS